MERCDAPKTPYSGGGAERQTTTERAMKKRKRKLIISVYRPDLLDEAIQHVGVSQDTEVFLDRRVGERRRPERVQAEAYKGKDRRRRNVDEALRADGIAVVDTD